MCKQMQSMLNNLALRYIETRQETDFNTLYSEFNRVYSGKYPYIANQFNNDVHSVQAAYEDTLLKALKHFKPGQGVFSHYLNRALKNTLTDLRRTYNRRNTEILVSPVFSGDVEEKNIFYTVSDGVDVAAEVIDQLASQLFEQQLYQQAASDSFTMLLALQMIYEGETVHSTAQQLGMCHKTVKRRLRKILGKAV